MDSLIEAGYSQDEAWQMTRERYLILRPGGDEDDDASVGSERTRAIFETLTEMANFKNDIDELEAQASGLASQPRRDGED